MREGVSIAMESRQRKSSDTDKNSKAGDRKLARAIIISGIRDLGLGRLEDIPSHREWRRTLVYVFACKDTGWSKDWIDSIFDAVEDLHLDKDSVRKDVTKQCVLLLRKLD